MKSTLFALTLIATVAAASVASAAYNSPGHRCGPRMFAGACPAGTAVDAQGNGVIGVTSAPAAGSPATGSRSATTTTTTTTNPSISRDSLTRQNVGNTASGLLNSITH